MVFFECFCFCVHDFSQAALMTKKASDAYMSGNPIDNATRAVSRHFSTLDISVSRPDSSHVLSHPVDARGSGW